MRIILVHYVVLSLIPCVLSAPISYIDTLVLAGEGHHIEDRLYPRRSRQQPAVFRDQLRRILTSAKAGRNLEVLTRASKSIPGDRWPYALSSLKSEVVAEYTISIDDKPGETIFPATRSIQDQKVFEHSTHQNTHPKTVLFRYLTLFSKSASGPEVMETYHLHRQPFSDRLASSSINPSYLPSAKEDVFSALAWVFGHPIWAWTTVSLLIFALFIISVITVEILTVLCNLVRFCFQKDGSRSIRLDGAEQKLASV
ncbi:hypothetical protein LOZ53_001599 [Ophidiomyces ophidiicola]|uniref:Uncharacterized protein n=1 Tax=Ophidiomyces ophidiicola TaxID=1387563 RepID=A0ACB8UU16_9EURO|nr:hypothetical protein LOZ61_002135 [Ophidiomyces ophidiicola]KAI1918964.1 hypothetical protein LOZ64_002541 [Ophidiomyces ophidiicola]KAI1924432.1 hypothetical protein LOZ60_004719 [Ophidiomyces ophidiicola]KAI1941464.1 hypothetical protein LOZ62_004750 [Ophidiomyces ophidiicola]KAI1953551.1 hypothetical protein LOZ59_005044 [Ophidiomyces ophidiicola]